MKCDYLSIYLSIYFLTVYKLYQDTTEHSCHTEVPRNPPVHQGHPCHQEWELFYFNRKFLFLITALNTLSALICFSTSSKTKSNFTSWSIFSLLRASQ